MNRKRVGAAVFLTVLLFVGFLALFAALWYLDKCGDQGINAILFTLTTGTNGVEKGIWISFALRPLLLAVLCTAIVVLAFRHSHRLWQKETVFKTYKLLCLLGTLCLLAGAAFVIGLPQWLLVARGESRLFDDNYVEPKTAQITFPEKKRNLIYIYLESMETTFFSQEQGGCMDMCVIPELYALAAENTNFSSTDQVGGWQCVTGGTWTTAGTVTQVGGIPLLLPYDKTITEQRTRPLPGATLLWDILADQGYYQMVMMGSDKYFADQLPLMTEHGVNEVKDYNSALAEGIIPEGYFEWWGMEDEKVFAYARRELTKIAAGEQPFNFTLFTIDTHYPNGYTCPLCGDARAERYENVYACSSAQVAAFVAWIQAQPFYENTTVILCGDHLSMDQAYIRRAGLENADRWVYNCILNAPIQTENTRNRVFTSLDMFPTTLAALGCRIKGDRLALGTNLYSNVPTLAEKLGMDTLNTELTQETLSFFRQFLENQKVS